MDVILKNPSYYKQLNVSLGDVQKGSIPTVALGNVQIGAASPITDAVRYSPQELTEEQQAQARENINAADADMIPEWAMQPEKPTYTKREIGLGNVDNVEQYSEKNPPPYPVTSVNGKKGAVNLSASDVGADASGTAASAVSEHNASDKAHNDIRLLIEGLAARLSGIADSDDTTLDQLSEIVAYIKSNKSLIDSITTNKVNVSDIINNLTSNVSNKPLSAAQGVVLKALIDAITVPTKLSQLDGDATHRTVTDVEKTTWNGKAAGDHKHTKSEITDFPSAMTPTAHTHKKSEITDFAHNHDDKYQPKGNYLTSIPSEYVTDSELNAKGYAKKTELDALEETLVNEYVPKNQGSANVGKILVVGTDGNLVLADMPEGGASGDVVGVLDDANNILLTGALADGTYTLKYEYADGTVAEVGSIEVGAIIPPTPSYTNFADPSSPDWVEGKRFNSAGELVDVDAGVNGATTNYIGGLVVGDIIRVQGMDLTTYRTVVYDSAKSSKTISPLNNAAHANYFSNVSANANEASATINANTHLSNGGYLRFCGPMTGTSADVIITIERNGTLL